MTPTPTDYISLKTWLADNPTFRGTIGMDGKVTLYEPGTYREHTPKTDTSRCWIHSGDGKAYESVQVTPC